MISGSLIHLFSSLPKPKTNVTIKQLHPCITTTEAIATKNWKRGEKGRVNANHLVLVLSPSSFGDISNEIHFLVIEEGNFEENSVITLYMEES